MLSTGRVTFQSASEDYAFPTWVDEKSMPGVSYGSAGEDERVFSNNAVNIPLVYAPQIVGYVLGRLLHVPLYWVVVLMRITGLLFYAAVVILCLRVLPVGKWPFAIIASLPATLITVSSVSADTMAIGAAFVFVSLLMLLMQQEEMRLSLWIAFGLACVVLPVAKLAYAPLLMLVVLVPLVNPAMRGKVPMLAIGGACLAGCVLLFFWWQVIGGINTGAMWREGINTHEQLAVVLESPLGFLKMVLLALPTSDVLQLANWGVFGLANSTALTGPGWLGIALLCLAVSQHDYDREFMPHVNVKSFSMALVLFAVAFAACAFLVFLALYLSFNEVGASSIDGVQARYFIPMAPLVVLLLSMLTFSKVNPLDNRGATDGETVAKGDAAWNRTRTKVVRITMLVLAIVVSLMADIILVACIF